MPVPVEPRTARESFAITPSDTVELSPHCDGIWVGVAGNVAIKTPRGTTLTYVGAQAGTYISQRCSYVMSTNTTATSLIGVCY